MYPNIKKLRERGKYTQLDIANQLNLSRSAYTHIETGRVDITIDNLIKLADFYRVSCDYILDREILKPYIDIEDHGELFQLCYRFRELENKEVLLIKNMLDLINKHKGV